MREAALLLFTMLALSPVALADDPPSWSDFEVRSANHRFMAEVKARPDQAHKKPDEREYELSVYEVAGGGRRKLWSAAYRHDGNSLGLLSDDGSAYAHVSFWYYADAPVVSVYRAGRGVRVIRGEEFAISPSDIRQTVSHELWLSNDPWRVEFSGSDSRPQVLYILTIDRRLQRVDVEAGTLLK